MGRASPLKMTFAPEVHDPLACAFVALPTTECSRWMTMIDLNAIGESLEHRCGEGFVALYLVGSFGTTGQIPTSDIDLILVTKDHLGGEQLKTVWETRDDFRRLTGELVDIHPRALTEVLDRAIALKQHSKHIWGRDIRDQICVPDVDTRIAQLASAATMFSRRTHNVQELAVDRLDLPDADDEFLGYLDLNGELPLKSIMSFSFHAAARLASRERIFVLDKHEIPHKYASAFSDWTCRFVQSLFTRIRGTWHYRMPTAQDDREELRLICAKILPFEQVVLPEITQQAGSS